MADKAWSSISGGSQVVRKSVVITSSQNWVAPLALAGSNVWLTGCAAGGSGAQNSYTSASLAFGGCGGCYVEQLPVPVTAGATYAVVIPAGGAGVTSGNGSAGGDLTFGSLLTIKGGSGGKSVDSSSESFVMSTIGSMRGIKPYVLDYSGGNIRFLSVADSVNGNVCGNHSTSSSTGVGTGGATGYFGNGANSASSVGSVNAPAATANSGAGGGCVYGASVSTSGAGGSGKLIIEWDEFL